MWQLCNGSGEVKNSDSDDGGKEVRVMSNRGENRSGGRAIKKQKRKKNIYEATHWASGGGTKRTETMWRDDWPRQLQLFSLGKSLGKSKRHIFLWFEILKGKTNSWTSDEPKTKEPFQAEAEERRQATGHQQTSLPRDHWPIKQNIHSYVAGEFPQESLMVVATAAKWKTNLWQKMTSEMMNSNRISALKYICGAFVLKWCWNRWHLNFISVLIYRFWSPLGFFIRLKFDKIQTLNTRHYEFLLQQHSPTQPKVNF